MLCQPCQCVTQQDVCCYDSAQLFGDERSAFTCDLKQLSDFFG